METGIWIMVAMFSYYLLNQGLNVYNQNKEREFELKKLQIKNSRRNVVAPLALSLMSEITSKSLQIPSETAKELIKVLNKTVEIIRVDPTDQSRLEEPINDLTELLNTGNLGADLAIKIQQIIEGMSAD